jgi:hypothetical protein
VGREIFKQGGKRNEKEGRGGTTQTEEGNLKNLSK